MTKKLLALTEVLANARVLCVGDVILDHFNHGSVERISPEAPIPVLRLEHKNTMLGGAGNVVRNLAALGVATRFITVVGDDNEAEKVKLLIKKEKISDIPIVDNERKTSTKSRYLAAGQQMLRVDSETPFPLGDDVRKQVVDAIDAMMIDCNVVVLSDYAKGVLDDGMATELILAARKIGKTIIVDPKGTDYRRYKGANIITPNRHELGQASNMPVSNDDEIAAAARSLIDQHDFDAVLATLGENGMALFVATKDAIHLEAEKLDVFDVSGAGDTVVAVLAAALAAGADLSDAAALANTAAGVVVGKVGTAVVYAEDILDALRHQGLLITEVKLTTLKQAIDRIGQWRRKNLKTGFTNGCFDLIHPGHVSLLKQAKGACDRLIVGLNSDSSVKRLGKGEDRPVQNEAARANVLASMIDVDMVIIFSDDTPLKLIDAIRPDVLVKGADYELNTVVGADIVQGYGGKVILAKLEPGHSTSATISRMTNSNK